MEGLIGRVQLIDSTLDTKALNWRPEDRPWSSGQILDHMNLAVAPYLDTLTPAITGARRCEADPDVVHSWFGQLLIKASGPSGNAPAPKKLHPKSAVYDKSVAAKWIELHRHVIALAQRARGLDLTAVTAKNPFIRIFRMNLADFFEVLTVHAERHVSQIERLAEKAPK